MSGELLAAQLSIVVLANHHTLQLLRLLTVASPSEDDKSYGGMRHRQTFSDLCLHRKKRNDQSLSQHLGHRCRDGRLSSAGFFKNKRPKLARQPHSGVYLENHVLGNCFQWTEVSNYPQASAKVPTIEAAYVVECTVGEGWVCFYSGPDKLNAWKPPPSPAPSFSLPGCSHLLQKKRLWVTNEIMFVCPRIQAS